jgi:hypothetical protein
MIHVIGWAFIAFLVVLGLSGLVLAVRLCIRATATRRWAVTNGHVIATTGDIKHNRAGEDYWIKYTYSVANQEYTNKTIGLAGAVRPRSHRERHEMGAYHVGTPVSVFYDPRHPEDAMLKRDIPWSQISVMLFGSLLALAWATLLVVPPS